MGGVGGGKGPWERVLELQEVGVLWGKAADNQGQGGPPTELDSRQCRGPSVGRTRVWTAGWPLAGLGMQPLEPGWERQQEGT